MTHPTLPLSRREFLKAGAATAVAAAAPMSLKAAPTATADACIVLMLTGGPSQIDTFDPKPNAASDVRGPFRTIRSAVPGLHLSELFPRMAATADRFSFVRSLHHTAAPIHETGYQLVQTGRLFRDGPEWPNAGAVVAHLRGQRGGFPAWWVLPDANASTGVSVSHGQGTGFLGSRAEPSQPRQYALQPEPWTFDVSCRAAAAAVRSGARFVTVNMFDTVFDAPSWDCHADRGSLACDLNDYRDTVAPLFDAAFTGLLADLDRDGTLARTLVVATGEFGRTPHTNANGGRDHWPGCWTAILAGGGVQGGRVVGSSDALGGEPKYRPVTPAELVATIYHALGIPPHATLPGPDGTPVRVIDAAPVTELF
ncbi:MAG TPA: DUF1501 domain-containing protein [Fimbriiglobus sp.]|nr:DUF1501 domain-containing protein [Fimbriiglobus sp.]